MALDVGPLDFTVMKYCTGLCDVMDGDRMDCNVEVGFMINSATRWPRIRGLFDVTGLPTSAVRAVPRRQF